MDGVATRVLRANRAMRGALVSAGTRRLVYSYRPRSVLVGAVLSGIGLVLCHDKSRVLGKTVGKVAGTH